MKRRLLSLQPPCSRCLTSIKMSHISHQLMLLLAARCHIQVSHIHVGSIFSYCVTLYCIILLYLYNIGLHRIPLLCCNLYHMALESFPLHQAHFAILQATLRHIKQECIVLCYYIVSYVTLQIIALYCILRYVAQHCIAFYYNIVHYVTLHRVAFRVRFLWERLGTAFPHLFWPWECRSHIYLNLDKAQDGLRDLVDSED